MPADCLVKVGKRNLCAAEAEMLFENERNLSNGEVSSRRTAGKSWCQELERSCAKGKNLNQGWSQLFD